MHMRYHIVHSVLDGTENTILVKRKVSKESMGRQDMDFVFYSGKIKNKKGTAKNSVGISVTLATESPPYVSNTMVTKAQLNEVNSK